MDRKELEGEHAHGEGAPVPDRRWIPVVFAGGLIAGMVLMAVLTANFTDAYNPGRKGSTSCKRKRAVAGKGPEGKRAPGREERDRDREEKTVEERAERAGAEKDKTVSAPERAAADS